MIYVNSPDREVTLSVPVQANVGTLDVSVWDDNNNLLYEVATAVQDTEGDLTTYSFTLPFYLVQYDRNLRVRWQFSYTESSETYEYDEFTELEVVTPILTPVEIRAVLDDPANSYTATDDEVERIERAVRYVIQAHTGQSFGKFTGVQSVTGSGDTFLRMPQRLIKLTSVNGNASWVGALALRGGGWYLRSRVWGLPSVRADYDGWHENPYTSQVPLVAPYSDYTHPFLEHVEYEIDGIWGWNSVPQAVKEAAKLLVNDYACADANYRDRFLTSMTAADWRIQFHEGAFSNTGNVRANQLLSEYVLRRGWAVI